MMMKIENGDSVKQSRYSRKRNIPPTTAVNFELSTADGNARSIGAPPAVRLDPAAYRRRYGSILYFLASKVCVGERREVRPLDGMPWDPKGEPIENGDVAGATSVATSAGLVYLWSVVE